MAKHLVVAIDWYGPYPGLPDTMAALAEYDWMQGLYLAIGKSETQPEHGMQYVGISRSLHTRVKSDHATLAKISDLTIWLGEVGTAQPSGKRVKKTPATLDYPEWLMAYYMALPLNSKKKANSPPVPISLLNRWWKRDFVTPYVKRPDPSWPDFIDYLGPDFSTKIVWFGKKMKRIKPLGI